MTDYDNSTQVTSWIFTPALLDEVRARANYEARLALTRPPLPSSSSSVSQPSSNNNATVLEQQQQQQQLVLPVQNYASGYTKSFSPSFKFLPPNDDDDDDSFLTFREERLLIQFYSGKLFSLIGPDAQVSKLRRDVKVAATASLLFRRFFLSNSVMVHDPKAILVAAAFLGSKVEDATVDIRYLEEGTKQMQAHVTIPEIILAELRLIEGVRFELLCFHPYKTVLAYTEDLRTYIKSEKGKSLVSFPEDEDDKNRPVIGEDLRPIHDEARKIVDDVVVSDVPFLFSPGQIGLATMMVANEDLQVRQQLERGKLTGINRENDENDDEEDEEPKRTVPRVDFYRYIQSRFEDQVLSSSPVKNSSVIFLEGTAFTTLITKLRELCIVLRGLREGKFGCGNHVETNIETLKGIHKKLKKCRAWGKTASGYDDGDGGEKTRKKKKKRKADDTDKNLDETKDSQHKVTRLSKES